MRVGANKMTGKNKMSHVPFLGLDIGSELQAFAFMNQMPLVFKPKGRNQLRKSLLLVI